MDRPPSRALAACVLLTALACSDLSGPGDASDVATIEINPPDLQMGTVCDPRQLSAVVRDSRDRVITGRHVTWRSTDTRVATVDITGVVRAVGNGSAQITANLDSASASAPVTVTLITPDPVTLNSVSWSDEMPLLSWTRSDHTAFCEYRVWRDGNWGPHISVIGDGIDTIADRSTTTYLDTRIIQRFGIDLDYKILTANGPVYQESNIVNIDYTPTIPVRLHPDVRPVLQGQLMYVLEPFDSDSLKVVSTADNSVVAAQRLMFPRRFALSGGGDEVYVVTFNSNSLLRLDAATLDLLATSALPFPGSYVNALVAGRPNRLYLSFYDLQADTGAVVVLNATDGTVIGGVRADVREALLDISADGNVLFLAESVDASPGPPALVLKIDVATDNIGIVAQREAEARIQSLQLSPDGQRLYVGHGFDAPTSFVDVWNANLASLDTLLVSEELFDVYVTGTSVYLSESQDLPDGRFFLPGTIVQYDAASLTAQASWDFVQVPATILISEASSTGYAMDSDGTLVFSTN